MKKIKLDKNILIDLYHTKKKSTIQISKILCVSKRTILRRMKEYNIPRRTPSEAFHLGGKKGNKNGMWKSDMVKYGALHSWVNRNKIKIGICTICNEYKRTEFANIDHKYNRNLNDYMEVCTKCHRLYDKEMITKCF